MFYVVTFESGYQMLVFAVTAVDAIEKAANVSLLEVDLWKHGDIKKCESIPFVGCSDKITKEGVFNECIHVSL